MLISIGSKIERISHELHSTSKVDQKTIVLFYFYKLILIILKIRNGAHKKLELKKRNQKNEYKINFIIIQE